MPEATAESFDEEGYFFTGDVVKRDSNTGRFTTLGRQSVDIIKTGGFKVSALEVEATLQELQMVSQVAVCGTPDDDYGERVCALVTLSEEAAKKENHPEEAIRTAAKERLAPQKVPSRVKVVNWVPRNNMGKVNKKEVKREYFESDGQ